MTALHDRLSDLADQAPSSAATQDMWAAGRRLHRRQQVGTGVVVVTVVALLAGLTGFSWSRSDVDVQPASPEAELGMPDRFYEVSERLPGTDDVGPIGPLSAVLSGRERLVGISGTGEYAFLDLPAWPAIDSLDFPVDPAVSADGTKVAYWSVGEPSGEPISEDTDPVVAVRVYDTVTEDMAIYAVPTEHGLQPADLVWTDETLWFEVWQYDPPRGDGGRSATGEQTVAWDPETDAHRVWDRRPDGLELTGATSWQDAVVSLGGQGALRLHTPERAEVRARIDTSSQITSPVFLADAGDRLVGIRDTDGPSVSNTLPQPLLLGTLPDPADLASPIQMRQVPDAEDDGVNELLGWRDESHVVAIRSGVPGVTGGARGAVFVSVDVETGESEVLAPLDTNVPEFAADALRGPVFDAPPPPDPLDLRIVYGGILAILLVGGGAVLWWRRRVQR